MRYKEFLPDTPSPLRPDRDRDRTCAPPDQRSQPTVAVNGTSGEKVSDTKVDEGNRVNAFIVDDLELREFPLFKRAPDSFYNKIISCFTLVTYHPQCTIIKMGSVSKSMYWILKGTVSITSGDEDSIYNELGSGHFFGEIGMLFNRPRTANVVAKTKVLVGILNSRDFNNVLKAFPLMERQIRDEAQERLAMLDRIKHRKTPTLLPPILPSLSTNKSKTDNLDNSICIQHFLKSLPIFQNLAVDIIHKLALGVEPVTFNPYQYIFHEHDEGCDIYFIVSGQVEVLNGHHQVLAKFGDGSYFGEMSFLAFLDHHQHQKRSASIRTITTVELIVVRSQLLMDLCCEYPFLIDHMKRTSESRVTPLQSLVKPTDPQSYHFKAVSPSASEVSDIDDIFDTPKMPLSPCMTKSLVIPTLVPKRKRLNSPAVEHIPHTKRLKLQEIIGRKSSVLAYNSPLSESLLTTIFSYLDLVTLMKLRRVCRRWRQVLYMSPTLCTTLDLTPWSTLIDDHILISIVRFVGFRPQHIDISNCFHITDKGFSYMINEIGISGQIKSIKMKSLNAISSMAIMDLTVPSVGGYLEEIDLSNCKTVGDSVVQRLIGWSNGFEHIGCKKLTTLNLGYCKHLTDSVMYHLGDHCSDRLKSLDLTRCTTITDQGFEYWSLRYFPNLTSLCLRDCTFLTDKAVIAIANGVPNLANVNLSFCCSLTDMSLQILCILCQSLECVDMSFCGSAVSDSGLLAVSGNLKRLRHLTIKGCIRVTRAGIDSLLSSDLQLRYLDVSQCKNSDVYPGQIPAQKLNVNPVTKSAFVKAGSCDKVVEIVI